MLQAILIKFLTSSLMQYAVRKVLSLSLSAVQKVVSDSETKIDDRVLEVASVTEAKRLITDSAVQSLEFLSKQTDNKLDDAVVVSVKKALGK